MSSTTPDPVALAGPLTGSSASDEASRLTWAVRDTLAMTQRNLLHITRVPQLLVFTFIQPVMFVLLFRYVFGGAIPIEGLTYVDYLMPGIFAQTVMFGASNTAVGLAEDLGSGIVERFRSLPMARLAVLTGRTLADVVRNVGVMTVMLGVGFAVGFRPEGGVLGVLAGVAIVLAFAFALSWVFANVGLGAANAEAAQAVAFPIMFPLTFASSAFVPVNTMPGWLQAFAAHQPVTVVINAARSLMLGPDATAALERTGQFQSSGTSYVIQAVLWISAVLAVAAPLAVRRYRRTV
jgi:ABC-2 type transport system permease protein/oleandomycin transport system permease protein